MADDYGISPEKKSQRIDAPDLDHSLPTPNNPADHPIGLIGAGAISEFHLRAYQKAGYHVSAIADHTLAKAEARRDEFFPDATVTTNPDDLLNNGDIAIVDLTPHPEQRSPLIHAALDAGKHVLSQKPLAATLDEARALADHAAASGKHLAVNQNGRWAPHFLYLRRAIAADLIGKVRSIDFNLQWDQTWIAGLDHFESLHHLILYDFAIHWFDITACFMGDQRPDQIFASAKPVPDQLYRPPSLAAATIDYPDSQVRMSFNAHTTLGEEDTTTIVGSKGTLRSRGPGLNEQPQIDLFLENGHATVPLTGCWFDNGFAGSMGELLCALEENRPPEHHAANNLNSLQLCFAAMQSADRGTPARFSSGF